MLLYVTFNDSGQSYFKEFWLNSGEKCTLDVDVEWAEAPKVEGANLAHGGCGNGAGDGGMRVMW